MERVKWRGKWTRNSSKLQGLLMERNNVANYISEGYLFQNEFSMKKKNKVFSLLLISEKERLNRISQYSKSSCGVQGYLWPCHLSWFPAAWSLGSTKQTSWGSHRASQGTLPSQGSGNISGSLGKTQLFPSIHLSLGPHREFWILNPEE